jgi:plasmid stabilization system protein ParE
MSKYQFTPQALNDIFDIWSFIARDNLDAADRVEEAIYQACELLSGTPLAGRIREDLTSLPLRFWLVQPYSNYFIVYDPGSSRCQKSSCRASVA